jgi:hypothetical protein
LTLEWVRLVGVTDCRGEGLGGVVAGRTATDFGVVGPGGVEGGRDACRVVFAVVGDVVLVKLRATSFAFFGSSVFSDPRVSCRSLPTGECRLAVPVGVEDRLPPSTLGVFLCTLTSRPDDFLFSAFTVGTSLELRLFFMTGWSSSDDPWKSQKERLGGSFGFVICTFSLTATLLGGMFPDFLRLYVIVRVLGIRWEEVIVRH